MEATRDSLSNKTEAVIILKKIKIMCNNDRRYLRLSYIGQPVHKQNDLCN